MPSRLRLPFLLVALLWLPSLHARGAVGTPPPTAADSARLAREALEPGFIRASLLVLEPGREVYSAFGHAALRLECPSKGLDYSFTFEMDTDLGATLSLLFHRAKAGFAAAPTPLFLRQYRAERRGVKAYRLNLNPVEKQTLWRNLDQEVAAGAHWDYDYPAVNCASMCIYMVEKSLANNRLTYHHLSPILNGTYRDVLHHISQNAPWARLVWDILLLGRGDKTGQPEDKMTPALLAEAWQHATLTDSTGHSRPLITGRPAALLPAGPRQEPGWFTPAACALLLAGLLCTGAAAGLLYRKRKH